MSKVRTIKPFLTLIFLGLYSFICQFTNYLVYRFAPERSVINPTMAWGIPIPNVVVIALIVVIIVFIVWYSIRYKHNLSPGIVLILSGGLSNLIDRVVHGGVFDYIDLSFLPSFPTFNIADAIITIGAGIIIIEILFGTKLKRA